MEDVRGPGERRLPLWSVVAGWVLCGLALAGAPVAVVAIVVAEVSGWAATAQEGWYIFAFVVWGAAWTVIVGGSSLAVFSVGALVRHLRQPRPAVR